MWRPILNSLGYIIAPSKLGLFVGKHDFFRMQNGISEQALKSPKMGQIGVYLVVATTF